VLAALVLLVSSCSAEGDASRASGSVVEPTVERPPAGAGFDYQLGGDAPLPDGVAVVVRDWFAGSAVPGVYSICYVNAFQTQPPDDADRPDEREGWPAEVVSDAEDAAWPGEFAIDLSSAERRAAAAAHVVTMIDECAAKGFQAVEFDNLDSYTRFPELGFDVPEAIEYAAALVAHAHSRGLAAGQKNAVEIAAQARSSAGFDFVVAEECGAYDECDGYVAVYGDAVLAIEYTEEGFAAACATLHPRSSVIFRDVNLVLPDDPAYRRRVCP